MSYDEKSLSYEKKLELFENPEIKACNNRLNDGMPSLEIQRQFVMTTVDNLLARSGSLAQAYFFGVFWYFVPMDLFKN